MLLLAFAMALQAPLRAQEGAEPGGPGVEARPVYDASDWAHVLGPLRSLWDAWKAKEAEAGRQWNDLGSTEGPVTGATVQGRQRADSVPPEAVAWMATNFDEATMLVAPNADSVPVMQQQEAQRAEAAQAAVDAANQADSGEGDGEGDGDGAGDDDGAGEGPDADSAGRPGDDAEGGEGDGEGPDPSGDGEDVPDLTDGAGDGAGSGDTSYTLIEDLVYDNKHDRNKLDLYLPEGHDPQGTETIPVVVHFHGGGFYRGDKKDGVVNFLPLVEEGYALASANYLLLNKSSPGDVNFLEDAGEIAKAAFDARAAVRWLKDNAGEYALDPQRFAVAGASAGGYLAATVGAGSNVGSFPNESASSSTSASVKAVIDWSGPTNFATFPEHKGDSLPAGTDMVTSVLQSRGAVSPFDYVDGSDPPHLIRHGRQDPVVPYQQSETYAAELKGAGVQVDVKIYDDLAHEPDPQFLEAEQQATSQFLNGILK